MGFLTRSRLRKLQFGSACLLLFLMSLSCFFANEAWAREVTDEASLKFGFSKLKITPEKPIRLSGYGSRKVPSVGVDEELFVRSMAIEDDSGKKRILVSVESIGFPGVLTQEIFAKVKKQHQISREDFVVCFTHNHTAPQIARGLPNLFDTATSEADLTRIDQYTQRVAKLTVKAVDAAIADLSPGNMFVAMGKATFARNRRVLKEGIWSGFGENANGPVDHSLPLIRVTDEKGETRGLIFNYACHCTTFGGEYNKVNGDWAGYATQNLESDSPGVVAICTIGCGADSNPLRNSERALELAKSQGQQISDEVKRLVAGPMRPLTQSSITASYGFAGLPIDRPDDQQLQQAMESPRLQVRNHAQKMLEIKQRMGRLPETYPMPIQIWDFGGKSLNDKFIMVFLGGEVCVDYATRIRKELSVHLNPDQLDNPIAAQNIWVSAYANDVFGYVAPEAMQTEGGYEVDFSMIYYLQPGRWSSGTEEVILKRVNELAESAASAISFNRQPGVPSKIESSIGLTARLLASEPAIRDPISMCIDAKGRLWVVEMGDYPGGDPAHIEPGTTFQNERAFRGTDKKPWDGEPGGRIKLLHDRDGDGRYEDATVFLEGLKFPTGVFPWKDGLLVCAAPEIFFAQDTDGKSDVHETLYSGFPEANPQHRVNGFEWGLDGWLYLAAGNHKNGEITSLKTGEKVNTSGRDVRIEPHSGAIEAISGPSQWCRCRDDFGNWYGNDNTRPLYQFVIEERFLKRNPFVPSPTPRANLTTPPQSPPVYPTSQTEGRFNDLATMNRFTSACGPAIFRNCFHEPSGPDSLGRSSSGIDAFVCEPVHNLVSRLSLTQNNVEFSGQRVVSESNSEFLSSEDNWFRPVRILSAPNDDMVWVVDMYRQVIEHPEWIPESWQSSLDLYAGSEYGRIYALSNNGQTNSAVPDLASLSSTELSAKLLDKNGWQRDTAQRLLLERFRSGENLSDAIKQLEVFVNDHSKPTPARIQSLWTLEQLAPGQVEAAKLLTDSDVNVVINTIRALGLASVIENESLVKRLAAHENIRVRFEVALALGEVAPDSRQALNSIAAGDVENVWMRAAVLSSSVGIAESVLVHVFEHANDSPQRTELANGLIATAMGKNPQAGAKAIFEALDVKPGEVSPWQTQAMVSALDNLKRKGSSLAELVDADRDTKTIAIQRVLQHLESVSKLASEPQQTGQLTVGQISLLGHVVNSQHDVSGSLTAILGPQNGIEAQSAAVDSLGRIGFVEPLVEVLADSGPALQSKIQTVLLTRTDWAKSMLDGIGKDVLSVDDLSPSTRENLAEHRDSSIRDQFAKLISQITVTSRSELFNQYSPALELEESRGVSKIGAKLFETNCAACHRLGEIGKNVGPDLAGLQSKTREYLLNSILDPNRAIESKYRAYKVATIGGKFYSGMILEESATSLKLALADGSQVAILRGEIEAMQSSGKSFMPEGFEKTISVEQMRELLMFIETARDVPK